MTGQVRTFRHAHLACGIGAGARGFNMANPRIGNLAARFECAGGIAADKKRQAIREAQAKAKDEVVE